MYVFCVSCRGPTMKKTLLSIVCLLLAAAPASAQGSDCPPLTTRLESGGIAQVTPGAANRLRAEPTTGAAQIGLIPGEHAVSVLAGPVCADNVLWWQVDYQGLQGWTAEIVGDVYALEPMLLREFGGISFAVPAVYDEQHFIGELIPEEIAGRITDNPDFIEFPFVEGAFHDWLRVYPLAAYARIEPYVAEIIFHVQDMLAERPPLDDMRTLPHVLRLGAGQNFVGRPAYVDGANISGFHYLTRFAQAFTPLQRDSLSYIFQGITHDGAYYISLSVPVTVDVLPEVAEPIAYSAGEDEGETEYRHTQEMRELVNNADPTAIQPTMTTLSQIVLTLQIVPGTLLDALPEQAAADLPLVTGAACEGGEFPPRLRVGGAARQSLPADVATLPQRVPGGGGAGWSIGSGEIVGVLAGPVCFEGRNYWLLYQLTRGWSGWEAEAAFFFRDEAERYFYEPVDVPVDLPQLPSEGCVLLSLFNTGVYAEPNVQAAFTGSLIGGELYPADGLLQRAEGGYQWWRLPAGLTFLRSGASETVNTAVWVRVDTAFATPDCANLPLLSEAGG